MHSLRTAFQNEVRPGEYFSRALLLALLVAIGMAGMTAFNQGAWHLEFLMPRQGWFPRDPAGNLYVETWATILVNGLIIGFGFFGGWLILVGLVKIPLAKRFVPTCFTLGGALLVLAFMSAPLVQTLLQIAVQHYPHLTN
jgi:hypothetical protein